MIHPFPPTHPDTYRIPRSVSKRIFKVDTILYKKEKIKIQTFQAEKIYIPSPQIRNKVLERLKISVSIF